MAATNKCLARNSKSSAGLSATKKRGPYGSATQCREPAARLLRALVLLRLTVSARKFEEIVAQLMKDCLT
jgi:hypothetical protein